MTEQRVTWNLNMKAEPIVPAWETSSRTNSNGAELQTAILRGFSDHKNAVFTDQHKEFEFGKEFNFKEHGEFFRGALTMAGIRYAGDFYELLQRYGRIKVTIRKEKKVEDR